MDAERTEIGTIGEFGLIAELTKDIKLQHPRTVLGVGDDAAIVAPPASGKQTVVSTDLLCEGIHFDLMYAPLKHLGYKAIVVNLSDLCAMNALPTHVVVGLALSNRFSVEAAKELYAGMKLACERYKVDLIGGDTTSSKSGLMISVTAFGEVEKDKATLRNGAKAGDLVLVSGELGGAFMGLQVLEREKHVFQEAPGAQPDLTGFDGLLERQLKPEARVDVVEELAKLEVVPTSMIDISDGLASEALHIASASGCGVRLHEDKIPMGEKMYETARAFNLDPTLCTLSGGEDYELLFTVPQDRFEHFKNHPMFSIVGYMTDDPNERTLITRNGMETELKAQGWDGFKEEE
ncbi:MAG: thiamine-phosphate kinase [Flavobacteriales bacterium]|nr:thiamine-phosphate kinase [Flavobacteriales bacterium]